MKKSEIFKKLQNIDPIIAKGLGLSMEEIDYIKEKLLNDKLGLKLNFTEVDEKLEENYVLLKEIKKLHINPKDSKNHLIIEGDNYYALHALQIAGVKVDIIYIDPPYNTGREFTYKDDFGVTRKVGSDDPHRHSKWLSFMQRRLQLAKSLLGEEGVIFVSIDDNEQAYLKVLMDEIFGEDNFVGNINWQSSFGGKNDTKLMPVNTEYILFYGNRTKQLLKLKNNNIKKINSFTLKDDNYSKYGKFKISPLCWSSLAYYKNLDYIIYIEKYGNKLSIMSTAS